MQIKQAGVDVTVEDLERLVAAIKKERAGESRVGTLYATHDIAPGQDPEDGGCTELRLSLRFRLM